MSGSPLILNADGSWADRLPPEGFPLRLRFLDFRTNWLGRSTPSKSKLLDAVHEMQGGDLFVSNLPAVRRKNGGATTYCVWGEGLEALLPEADKVAFMGVGRGMVVLAEWAQTSCGRFSPERSVAH